MVNGSINITIIIMLLIWVPFFSFCFFFHINPSHPNPGRRGKTCEIFVFTLLCGASKGFMKAFKGFKTIKPFEAPQRGVKIKISLVISIQFSEIYRMERVKSASFCSNLIWFFRTSREHKENQAFLLVLSYPWYKQSIICDIPANININLHHLFKYNLNFYFDLFFL